MKRRFTHFIAKTDIGRKATVLRGKDVRRTSPYERRMRLELTELLSGRSFQGAFTGSVRQRANASATTPGPYAICVIGPV